MVQGIKVTPQTLNTSAQTVNGRASDVEGIQKGLNQQLSALAGGEWASDAAEQFRELWAKYNQGATQMIEALRGIGVLLNNAGHAYATAEADIARSFRA